MNQLKIYRVIVKTAYNDGVVAYLNGVEVARSNAPRIIKWDSITPEIRNAEVAITPETFDLSAQTDLLRFLGQTC